MAMWWQFMEPCSAERSGTCNTTPRAPAPATGTFRAWHTEGIGRLYFPLANEGGALSWTSPRLQGGLAASHHECLALPLTAEDLPHTLAHRDVWLVEPHRTPFSAAGFSPEQLAPHPARAPARSSSWIEAGMGWFSLTRRGPADRFIVTVTLWCPPDFDEPIEAMRVTVTNTTARTLTILPYAALPLFARSADNIRDHRHVTALLHRMRLRPHGVTVHPAMAFDERGHRPNATQYTVLAFGPGGAAPTDCWALQDEFLGEGGTFAAPAAVWQRQRAPVGRSAPLAGREAIGGFRFAACTLHPNARVSFLFLSGISRDPRAPSRWVRWAKQPRAATRSLDRVTTSWLASAGRIAWATADRSLDHWLAWVGIQPTLRRLYGNSYLPQFDYGRGGRGWRDLWQDCLALLLSDPASVRPMLLQHLGGVRIDGSNATIIGTDGRFLADRNNIPRTWMDHGAWPAHTILLYLDQTGDLDFLCEGREYFRDPQVFRCRRQDPAWRDTDGVRLRSRQGRVYRGSVLEHLLVQTLTAFFNVGEHNVCRLEGGDWNDGLDMASQRGESVAFSAFYAWNLQRLADLTDLLASRGIRTVSVAEELGLLLDRLPGRRAVDYGDASAKRRRLDRYLEAVSHGVSGRTIRIPAGDLADDLRRKHEDAAERIRRQEWIAAAGEQFFNGYYDNLGRRVEGSRPRGVHMTLTGQVFPMMAGLATDEQVAQIIRAVDRFLRDPATGGIRHNTDFGGRQPHLGRAFAFAYGEKENGSVFSHMAVLYAYALYRRRRPEAGRRVWHALYRMATDQPRAKIFPGLPEYFNAQGRGMYSYLTGSASWLICLLLTQAYGIRGEQGDLVIDPQLTREDFGARTTLGVTCRFAGRPLQLVFVNPRRLAPGRYAVRQLTTEHGRAIPFTARAPGGVRIARKVVERLAATQTTRLTATLSPTL